MDIISLVLGAILGVLFERIIPYIFHQTKKYIHNKELEARTTYSRSDKVHDWLINYYENAGSLNNLYNCQIGNTEIRIPFMSQSSWQFFETIDSSKDNIIEYAETENVNFPVDNKLIKKREKYGQVLFDSPSLYLDYINTENNKIKLHVKRCDYFPIATNMIHLEEESFRGIKNNNFTDCQIRNRTLSNIEVAQKIITRPFPIGCAVTFALKISGRYQVIIHTRSYATITYGGAKAVIPNFGLEPLLGSGENLSIIHYNFIKEYLEEMFNYEELINSLKSKRANTTWFYEMLPEAELLLKSNALFLEFTGFGFNLLPGVGSIALLARVEDQVVSKEIMKRVNANFEVAQQTTKTSSIDFLDYKSPLLETWLLEKRLVPASAFSLSRAITRLDTL